MDHVADERSAVDRDAQQRVGHDAGAQGRAHAGHAAPGAAGAVVATARAALDQLVELGAAERSQAPDVRHVRVERAQGHAHLPQFDVHAAVGQVVRRCDQLPVVDDLRMRRVLFFIEHGTSPTAFILLTIVHKKKLIRNESRLKILRNCGCSSAGFIVRTNRAISEIITAAKRNIMKWERGS